MCVMNPSLPGSEQWRFTADGDVDTSPTIINNTVYVGDDAGYLSPL